MILKHLKKSIVQKPFNTFEWPYFSIRQSSRLAKLPSYSVPKTFKDRPVKFIVKPNQSLLADATDSTAKVATSFPYDYPERWAWSFGLGGVIFAVGLIFWIR